VHVQKNSELSGWMKVIPVKTVVRDYNCVFRKLLPFVEFKIRIMCGCMLLTREEYKMCMGKRGMCDGYVELRAVSEIQKVSVSVFVVYLLKAKSITHPVP
jgi:hypothetical protein